MSSSMNSSGSTTASVQQQHSTTGAENGVDENFTDINDVRRNWREVEDFGVAFSMQQNEFSNHFDQNRTERRAMQLDTRLTKEEQELEDKYAAEYYEQLRLDREKEDELLALKMQQELDLEDEKKRKKLLDEDEALARRIQESEGCRRAPTTDDSAEAIRFSFSPSVPDFLAKFVQDAHDRNSTLNLPPNVTLEQLDELYNVVKDHDARLAQEIKDYQLALHLFRKETVSSKDFPPLENSFSKKSPMQQKFDSPTTHSLGQKSQAAASKATTTNSATSPFASSSSSQAYANNSNYEYVEAAAADADQQQQHKHKKSAQAATTTFTTTIVPRASSEANDNDLINFDDSISDEQWTGNSTCFPTTTTTTGVSERREISRDRNRSPSVTLVGQSAHPHWNNANSAAANQNRPNDANNNNRSFVASLSPVSVLPPSSNGHQQQQQQPCSNSAAAAAACPTTAYVNSSGVRVIRRDALNQK